MSYNVLKLVEILETLARNGQELTKLRVAKLIYLIDKYHIRKYGRPILRDRYVRLRLGPVPSVTLNIIDNFFFDMRFPGIKKFDEPLDEFFERGKDRRGYDKLKLKKEKDKSVWLSISDTEAIQAVLEKYGSLATSQLVDMCHRDKTSQGTPENSIIDYELFLDGLPEEKKKTLMELLEIDEENAHVLTELSR